MISMIVYATLLVSQLARAAVLTMSAQDASLFKMRVLSKEEIMAGMSSAHALRTVLKSRGIAQRPKLEALLRTELAQHLIGNTTAQQIQAHGKADPDKDKDTASQPKGYAALDGARDMLNEMMADAQTKLDNEGEKCQMYNTETLSMLEQIRQDVASFNSQAADARSRVLKAQSIIGFVQMKLPQVKEELEKHNSECDRQEAELNKQIGIVVADLDVMGGVLKIIGDCKGGDAGAALLQCRHCKGAGGGYVMLQNDQLQPLVNKLKSAAAKRVLQENLNKLYVASAERQEPVALTQEEARRQTMIMTGELGTKLRGSRQDPNDPEVIASMGPGEELLNISQVPDVTQPVDCVPTTKCTLGKGSCPKIRDRFLYVQSGIQDLLDQLRDELAELQRKCMEEKKILEAQIANLNERQSVAQTDLAVATKEQVDSESSSNLKAQHHAETTGEYGKTMKECCDEQNGLRSELCALEKIRGELYKLKGQNVFITDCQVSEWREGKCSASCGGGYLIKTRSIIVHPVDGMACPPLEMKESCNTDPCPIDCLVGDWEGWSGCSAECGGGVRERMRPVLRQMKYNGEPCDETQETEGCNAQACNKACVLADWSEWGACTQACWGGTQRSTRAVAEPAVGTGSCPAADSEPERITFRPCNKKPCTEYYQVRKGRNFLQCDSKADIIILLDGSGSLGDYGWKKSKVFVENLLRNLKGGDDNVKVALLLFSGPTTWEAYYRCIGQSEEAPDMEKDCQIKWVKHFTTDTLEAAETVEKLEFPDATTLTSVALGEAEAELINGREDASSTVVVVTDGWPLSQSRTREAAHQLMKKARVIWVPVGNSAPLEMIQELASLPKEENIIPIDEFRKLGWTYFANKVIAQTCPSLVRAV